MNTNILWLSIIVLTFILLIWLWKRPKKTIVDIEQKSDIPILLNRVKEGDLTIEKIDENISEKNTDKKSKNKKLVIALFIKPAESNSFRGTDIFTAMQQLELNYTKNKIFECYGFNNEQNKAIFSIANMFEPGIFDKNDEHSIVLGIVLFTQLPCTLDGRVIFELMFNYAQRIQEKIGGNLVDDQGHPIDAEMLDFLRNGINEFEQK
jgi:cell division protein ZipA